MPKRRFSQSSLIYAITLLLGCASESPEATSESFAFEEESHHGTSLKDDFDCDDAPGVVSFEDVLVRDGASCVLDAVHIDGDVQVETGGSLDLSNSVVDGNVQSDGGLVIRLAANEVDGDIQVKRTLPEGSVAILDNEVDGNIQVEENETAVTVSGNAVDGDLQFFENIAESPHAIVDNTIDGNLQCKDNEPDPLSGAGNVVDGDREDQCEVLQSLCPCAADLPSGWTRTFTSSGGSSATCPDGSSSFASVFDAVNPDLGALSTFLGRDCDGVIRRSCLATGGPRRTVTEEELTACQNVDSVP